jgi:hypothetical protein
MRLISSVVVASVCLLSLAACGADSQGGWGSGGSAPWGQAGPGGDTLDATSITSAMQSAGYQLPSPAPYAGAGAGTHGDINQLVAALGFFPGKAR